MFFPSGIPTRISKEGGSRIEPFRRAIRDLPVTQVSAAAQRDRPGPDSPYRQRDPGKMVLIIVLEKRPIAFHCPSFGSGRGKHRGANSRETQAQMASVSCA